MKVLVAIDGLSFSEAVIRAVAERPWPPASTFQVISVADTFAPSDVSGVLFEVTAAARATVQKAACQLQAAGLAVSTEVTEGHPATTIIAAAKKSGADFVFVGSHGNRAITRFLLGSTALAVVRHAPCSVEIVRVDQKNHRSKSSKRIRILLATDGSDCSALAARSIAGRPWPMGSEVRIICAPEFYPPLVDVETVDPEVWEDLRRASIDQADESVVAASKILHNSPLKIQTFVPTIFAGAKAVVLDEAWGWSADLIVMGSHGRRGLDRVLLGSFSEAIAMNTHCSVEVIRGQRSEHQRK